MTVAPQIINRGSWALYIWDLKSTDFVALPTPPLAHRTSKTIDMFTLGASNFNGSTIAVQGDLGDGEPIGTYAHIDNFLTVNSVPDTQTLSFVAATTKAFVVLPDVTRVKPVVTAGAPGTDGVRVRLLVTSARPRL